MQQLTGLKEKLKNMGAEKLNKGERTKKEILKALEKSLGVVTDACETAGVSRSLYYKYFNHDPEFREAVHEIQNVAKDFAESQLFQAIRDGNVTSIIFYLKTKAKDRGYIERFESVTKQVDEFEELTDDELRTRYLQIVSRKKQNLNGVGKDEAD